MLTPREQNIARATNLISNMDESINEVLLAFIVEANARGKDSLAVPKVVSWNGIVIPW